MWANKAVLITGGAGFSGSHKVDALLATSVGLVRVLDNLKTGKLSNLYDAHTHGQRFEFIEGDITDYNTCVAACKGIDIVFHQAALVSVPISITDPLLTHHINVTGTLNMLIAAKQTGVSRFIYASSAAVYGDCSYIPINELCTRNYMSPYALSKGICEDYVSSVAKSMTCIGLRYFNVYGPRQDPRSPYSGVVSIFMERALSGEPLNVFGDGSAIRDFVFVGDIVHANLLAGSAEHLPEGSHIFNVGSGNATSIRELIATIRDIINKDVTVIFSPERIGDITHSLADISKIKEQLGYTPSYTLEQGLRTIVAK
jgi:UDP-N-acetylglucosamine 4-epimerase